MKKEENSKETIKSRRRFLSIATSSIVGAGLIATGANAKNDDNKQEKSKNTGYKRTTHIDTYYKTSRF